MADVLVAYDKADFPVAQAFATTLKQLGYSVQFDAEGADAAPERALDTIKAAACVIALWSPQAISAERVNFEAAAAAALGKLISVKIDGEGVPRLLSHLPALNLARWDYRSSSPEVEAFFAALARLTKKKPSLAAWRRATGQGMRPQAIPLPQTREPEQRQPQVQAAKRKPPARQFGISPNRILRWSAGALGAAVLAVGMFFLGSQMGRLLDLRPPTTQTSAASTFESPAPTPQVSQASGPRVFHGEENFATLAELERYSWQEVARRIGQRLGENGAEALRMQAAEGNPAAKVELCIAHLRGIEGFAQEDAHSACLASAAQNHPAGQFLIWVARDRVGVNAADARAQLIAAAAQGWAPAQQLLASYYRNANEGFARDHAQARALLSAAAEKGYPRAMLDLSVVYLRAGSEEEREQAKAYLERVMGDREFSELCRPARATLVSLGEDPARCR